MSENIKKAFKLTPIEKKWVLYDVGNSAFVLLVSTIFPIYFYHLAESANISETDYLVYWGYAASIVTIIIALMGPILGSVADLKNMKKKLLSGCVIVGSIGCVALGLVSSWSLFLIIFIVAKIAFSLSLIFYDAMLTDVTSSERIDKVSSFGYAFGYIGSCIPFIISLVFVTLYEKLGLSFNLAIIIAFTIDGVWWLLMSIPLLKSYKQKYFVEAEQKLIVNSFSRLKSTIMDISKDKKVLFFMIAFFFYIDGVYTIIDMATAYGQALGIDSTKLLLALLVTQLVAFPFAIIFARLSQKIKSHKLISACIIAYFFIGVFAIFLRVEWQFWVLAVFVGMFQGGIQALSRSYFGKIIPPEKSGEYFGLMDICGKGASFLGTMLVSTFTKISGQMHIGVSIIAPLILIGFIFFRYSLKFANTTKTAQSDKHI